MILDTVSTVPFWVVCLVSFLTGTFLAVPLIVLWERFQHYRYLFHLYERAYYRSRPDHPYWDR